MGQRALAWGSCLHVDVHMRGLPLERCSVGRRGRHGRALITTTDRSHAKLISKTSFWQLMQLTTIFEVPANANTTPKKTLLHTEAVHADTAPDLNSMLCNLHFQYLVATRLGSKGLFVTVINNMMMDLSW